MTLMTCQILRRGAAWIAACLVVAALPAPIRAQVTVTTPLPGVRMAYVVNGGHPSALLVIDLCAPGIDVRTTRYEERGALASTWASRTGADAAVNGDFFVGGYSVVHWARSGGVDWPPGTHDMEPHPNIAFGPGFAMRGDLPPVAAATDVLGGIPEIVVGGATNPFLPHTEFVDGPHRRTAVGLSADRRTMFVFSTDGTTSIPGVHFGMAVMAAAVPGAPPIDWALNLDGGGSSQMWVRGVGTVIPSSRAVGSHLGIVARGSGAARLCPTPDPRCPRSGTAPICVDDTHIATCVEGIVASTGDCGFFGAFCSAVLPGGTGCVTSACVASPTEAPHDHDGCVADGRILHCNADGSFDDVRDCPAGLTCIFDGANGQCLPPGTVVMLDAGPTGDLPATDGAVSAPFDGGRAAPGFGADAGGGAPAGGGPPSGMEGGCSVAPTARARPFALLLSLVLIVAWRKR